MVGLDFTSTDESLIQYTASLCETVRPERIYFINIQEDLDVEPDLRELLSDPDKPRDEKLRDEMRKVVSANFVNAADYEIHYEVEEGSPTKELLRWSHIKHIDLLIVGKKAHHDGSGIVAQQIARKVLCSVLFVPSGATFQLQKIFVPVDFSSHSKMAMEEAISIANNAEDRSITCGHCYELPTGYYTTGKSEAEFAEIMANNAKKKFEKFSHGMPLEKISSVNTWCHGKPIAKVINEEASAFDSDLLIIGARGRTFAASILLGSVAEKLISYEFTIPLLIVKRKSGGFDIWDAIKKL